MINSVSMNGYLEAYLTIREQVSGRSHRLIAFPHPSDPSSIFNKIRILDILEMLYPDQIATEFLLPDSRHCQAIKDLKSTTYEKYIIVDLR